MSNTTLIISFSGTLRSMARGTVTPSDLEGAIFYFGCEEEYAKNVNAALEEMHGCGIDVDGRLAVYEQLRAAMDQAEGRIGYRKPGQPNSWADLNALLVSNGLKEIVPVDDDFPKEARYCYPAVVKAVEEQGLPYEVIWTR